MSYTADVKKELSYRKSEEDCCKRATLSGALRLAGQFSVNEEGNYKLSLYTQNNTEARWLMFKLNELYSLQSSISIEKNRFNNKSTYLLTTEATYGSTLAFSDLGFMEADENKRGIFSGISEWENTDHCRYCYYRGAFMSSGNVKNPEKGYRLEIGSVNQIELDRLYALLKKEELLKIRKTKRRDLPYIYLNSSEEVATFLNMIGSHKVLMDFENTRIEKSLRNDTNRMLNCDEYNSNRSVETKIRQIKAIEYIDKTKGLNILNDKLKEVALLRLNRDITEYNEILESMKVKVSKSTVQKRLAKIEEIARELGYIEEE